MTSSGGRGESEAFEEGDKVKYHPTGAGNVSEGEIKRIITEPEAVGGRQTVRASEEEPRYVCACFDSGSNATISSSFID